MLTFLIIPNLSFAPTLKRPDRTAYVIAGKIERPDYILQAIIQVESSGDPLAYNKKEQAIGLLQIRKPTLDEFNDIVGYRKYRLKDCWDRQISIEIYRTVQRHRNPQYDLKKALIVWNGKGKTSDRYYRKVQKQLNKLILCQK
jgi:hypothetical protein